MHRLALCFSDYCEQHFNLDGHVNYSYQSLSVCLLDCVYSLRTKYFSTTIPVVDRYAHMYMGGDRHASGDTITDLLLRIDANGGPEGFANNVLKNHQKLGGKQQIPKEIIVYQLAKYLRILNIDTLEDFRQFESPELLEIVIRAVKGIGDAGVNYLFMLAGDPNRCKPDVHIHHCIVDACGADLSNEECQILFTDAVSILKTKHPQLTVRNLDGIIWNVYQVGKQSTLRHSASR